MCEVEEWENTEVEIVINGQRVEACSIDANLRPGTLTNVIVISGGGVYSRAIVAPNKHEVHPRRE
jgi:hypothetical protein